MGNVLKNLLKAPSLFPQLLEQGRYDVQEMHDGRKCIKPVSARYHYVQVAAIYPTAHTSAQHFITAGFAKSWQFLLLNTTGNAPVPAAPRWEPGLSQVRLCTRVLATSTEFSAVVNNSTSPCKTLQPSRQAVVSSVWKDLQGLSQPRSPLHFKRGTHT